MVNGFLWGRWWNGAAIYTAAALCALRAKHVYTVVCEQVGEALRRIRFGGIRVRHIGLEELLDGFVLEGVGPACLVDSHCWKGAFVLGSWLKSRC